MTRSSGPATKPTVENLTQANRNLTDFVLAITAAIRALSVQVG
jgi:hypothetical protein